MEDSTVAVRAPVLEIADLRALESSLTAIDQGQLTSTGFYPRVFPVRGSLKFATGWIWNNR
jgi:hydroxyacylglutathione hydrolase